MLEAYAFFAVFTAQVVAMSVLYPAWLIRRIRAQAASFPAERFAQLYPDVDLRPALDRFLNRYRALNAGIAVLGLLLMGYLFSYMRRPDWNDGPVEALVTVYFLAQILPLLLIAWLVVRGNKVLKRSLSEGKRKAVLQRRGLFDFVSPSVVFLAVMGYFLFAAFVIYIQQDPFPGFAGYRTMGGMTLVYALNTFVVYTMLYGKKFNPFETHAGRLHTIGLTVKMSVYSCIVCVVFVSLNFTLVLLDLQRWEPFALSVFFVIVTLVCLTGLTAPPSPPEAEGLRSEGRLTR
jgi:hypothetical protein